MKDSGFGRLIGVLVSPGETFRSIAERPTWAAPLIVLIVLGIGLQWTIRQRTDMEKAVQDQMEAFGIELTQEQIDEQVEQAKKPRTQVLGAVAGIVFPMLVLLVGALLLWVGFRMFGSEIGYKASLATLLYGLVPLFVVAPLLNIPLVLGRESLTTEELMSGGVLMSHLGFLAGEDTSLAVRGLLQSVDFFSVWAIVLLVLGYRATARVSTGTAAGIVLAVWLLGVALKVGMMALPSLIMGGGS